MQDSRLGIGLFQYASLFLVFLWLRMNYVLLRKDFKQEASSSQDLHIIILKRVSGCIYPANEKRPSDM